MRRRRTSVLIAVTVAAATVGVVWPVIGLASSGRTAVTPASATFTDATGDSSGGPDVTTVQVSNDAAGKITFAASIPNRTSLGDSDVVVAYFDTDRNTATGDSGGFDYGVAWIQDQVGMVRWDGTQFVSVVPSSFSGSFQNGTASFSVAKADFGNSVTFNFIITTTGDSGDTTADRAPDTSVWAYPSGGSPSPPPPPPPPPPGSPPPPPGSPPPPPGSPPPPPTGVVLTASKFAVGKPHSGQKFTVSMVVKVKQTDVAVKTAVSCAATVAGKKIRATKKGSVLSGHASCTWKLPAHSKGKVLKGSITATYLGAKIKRSFSKRILP